MEVRFVGRKKLAGASLAGFVFRDVAYQRFPCVCGHSFERHRKVVGGCRGSRCDCRRFVNQEYVFWLVGVLRNDLTELLELAIDFKARRDARNRRPRLEVVR